MSAKALDTPLARAVHERFPQQIQAPTVFRRRQVVFHQADKVETVHYLLSGMIALERLDEGGRVTILRVLQPGSLFGWSDLLGGGTHRNGAIALQNSSVASFAADRFMAALQSSDHLASALFRHAAAHMDEYENQILRLSTLGVAERLYSLLRSLAGPELAGATEGVVEFKVPLMRRDLAALIATSPESLSRGIRRLEELEMATFHGTKVRLRTGSD